MENVLGLDIGTTAVKATVFRADDGTLLGSGLAEYTLETPRPDIVELDAEVYWTSAVNAIRQAVGNAACDPQSIAALSVTGQVETLIFLDHEGKSVRKAIVWLDNRAKDEAKELEAAFGADELFHLSGQTECMPCWPAPKILWLRKNEPENFRRTAKILMVEDFILYRLSGTFATCRGLLPSTLWYDIRTGDYDGRVLSFLGISRDQLPALHDPGEILGKAAGNDSPVVPGTLIAAAPLDHVCGCLGVGCTEQGIISETTGCTMALCAPFDRPVYDEQRRISTYHGFTPKSFVLLPWAPTAGMLLKHFRDEFCPGMSYADFDRAAASVPPGSEGLLLLPHCAGAVSPVCNPQARGAAYGITLAHKRGHWARAIMESVAYLLRDNAETLKDCTGLELREIRALGGASRSRLWLQIMADVMGVPISVTTCSEATGLGAAMLAAVAADFYATPAEAAKAMVRMRETVTPDARNTKLYSGFYGAYRSLNKLLMPTFGGNL